MECLYFHHFFVLFSQDLPELRQVVGEEAADSFTENPGEETLKTCFSAMMNASADAISQALTQLLDRFSQMGRDCKVMFITVPLHCMEVILLLTVCWQKG